MTDAISLPDHIDDFDAELRWTALQHVAAQHQPPPERDPVHLNMHCHTFFSYNGYDASPSHVAATAWLDGWHAAGICDFDVLDGLDEFFDATDLLGVRATVNMETRVFFREYADHEINSPGEPGVYYFMGAGFVDAPKRHSVPGTRLHDMREAAEARNRDVAARVNPVLDPVALDYDDDVLPLTPAGNATERHLCAAYTVKAREHFPEDEDLAAFWADRLALDASSARALLDDPMALTDKIRSKLMKAGGPGYVKPTTDTFPALDDVIAMIQACRAVPMATWLDGTSSGEADLQAQLECLIAKGVAAINIVPDRNWNLKDPAIRDLKIRKFHECVAIADRLHLPINIGTELNKYGQRWVDDFTAQPMRVVAPSFICGADIMVGHTRLLRFADISYCGSHADAEFGKDTAAKNDAFAAVGALPAPPPDILDELLAAEPAANYAYLRDAAAKGAWTSRGVRS